MNNRFEFKKDDSTTKSQLYEVIEKACDIMENIYNAADYPKLMVKRSWSKHNLVITGEMAMPHAYRWYLTRELMRLVEKGAEIKIFPSRPRVLPMTDSSLFDNADEDDWDITQKKNFCSAGKGSTFP